MFGWLYITLGLPESRLTWPKPECDGVSIYYGKAIKEVLVLLTIDNDPINKVDSLAGSIQVNLEALIVAWKILLSLEIVWVIFIVIGHGSLCRNYGIL